MSTNDPLVEWPIENWRDLKESFKTRWPFSASAYYMLETQEKWYKNGCNKVRIYVPYGDVKHGMVAICELTELLYAAYIFSLNDDLNPLTEALVSTKNVDWTRPTGLIIPCLDASLKEALQKVFERLDMTSLWENPTVSVIKKRDAALQSTFECPDEVHIVNLTKEHASAMNETWPHKFPGSVKFFEIMIEQNGGFGLLTKSGGELIAWVSQNEFGALCHLYCVEGHRRKGYAQILTRRQECKIAQDGHDTNAFIVASNNVSRDLFAKMGYETNTDIFLMHVIKTENLPNLKTSFLR